LQELFAFLANLPDHFHVAAVSRTKSAPYQQKAAIFCGLCPAEMPMFVLFFDVFDRCAYIHIFAANDTGFKPTGSGYQCTHR
jgi:hypothetical protein